MKPNSFTGASRTSSGPRPILLPHGHKLLNFYMRPFYVAMPLLNIPLTRVQSVEHYFQAMKGFYLMPPHMEDQEAIIRHILDSDKPIGAKRLGNALPINVPLWNGARVGHMLEGMIAKFHQHSDLRRELEVTDGRPLVEHSKDDIWGDGLTGRGLNLCGQTLELVRELFINGPE